MNLRRFWHGFTAGGKCQKRGFRGESPKAKQTTYGGAEAPPFLFLRTLESRALTKTVILTWILQRAELVRLTPTKATGGCTVVDSAVSLYTRYPEAGDSWDCLWLAR